MISSLGILHVRAKTEGNKKRLQGEQTKEMCTQTSHRENTTQAKPHQTQNSIS